MGDPAAGQDEESDRVWRINADLNAAFAALSGRTDQIVLRGETGVRVILTNHVTEALALFQSALRRLEELP